MSKANNRKEIKEKEELQARFQLGIAQANATVLSWLDSNIKSEKANVPTADVTSATATSQAEAFYNLPVISAGSGLNLQNNSNDQGNDAQDIHTIGDFINGNQKVSTLSKKKKYTNTLEDRLKRINDRHRIGKDDSKATAALKNKMRNDNRQKIREINIKSNEARNKNQAFSPQGNMADKDINDDSDDEEDTRSRNVKKGSNLLLDMRSKKKR